MFQKKGIKNITRIGDIHGTISMFCTSSSHNSIEMISTPSSSTSSRKSVINMFYEVFFVYQKNIFPE
jgi:hypothetical protein